MTRAELHSTTGFNPATLIAAAAHLRTMVPRSKGVLDATTLIRNDGRKDGYMEAIDDLIAAASKQPEATAKKDFQPYSQPAQNENPNRP